MGYWKNFGTDLDYIKDAHDYFAEKDAEDEAMQYAAAALETALERLEQLLHSRERAQIRAEKTPSRGFNYITPSLAPRRQSD
jgi:hypothetical protein